jgi:microcompartment protein CcmK/EutM
LFLAKVKGNVVSSVKNEYLTGHKLLIVREIDYEWKFYWKKDFISLDLIDSGIGDIVLDY